MSEINGNVLVSPQWLFDHKNDQNLIIVDCVSDKHEYSRAHISGAIMRLGLPFIKSIDEFGNPSLFVTQALDFNQLLYKLGIESDSTVVCYDSCGSYNATRFWWALKYYGHNNVKILNGGWQNWLSSGFPITHKSRSPTQPTNPFQSQPNEKYIISLEELKNKYNSPDWVILDTRSADEYHGRNFRGNKRYGHIPGAVSLEWKELMENFQDSEAIRKILPRPELEEKLSNLGITKDKTVITYCQGAIRAAHTAFVLSSLGYPNVRVYDGSMSEWANMDDTPLE